MKKVLLAVVLISFLASCKKNPTNPGGGGANISTLHERLPGKWDIVKITYYGVANLPPPFDTTQSVAFTGEGHSIVGYYEFDTIPNPNHMEFSMNFVAPLDLVSGGSIELPISEQGYATYEVNTDESLLEGVSYVIAPSGNDTTVVPSAWEVIENEVDKQKWRIDKVVYWDNNPNYPIDIKMTTTIEK